MSFRDHVAYPAVLAICLFGLSGCFGKDKAITGAVSENAFVTYLKKDGYTPLIMPSKLQQGGSLVYVRSNDDGKKVIQWVGDLISCGVPPTTVWGEPKNKGKPEEYYPLRHGDFPVIHSTGEHDFSAGLAIGFKGVGIDAGLGLIKKIKVDIKESGHETIQSLAVANYIADPLKRLTMEDYCIQAIETQKTAVLVDVAYIEKGTATFFGDNNGSVKLNAPKVTQALKLNANASNKVKSDGSMIINERIYVAFKESYYVPEEGTLSDGEDALVSATDDLVEALPDN